MFRNPEKALRETIIIFDIIAIISCIILGIFYLFRGSVLVGIIIAGLGPFIIWLSSLLILTMTEIAIEVKILRRNTDFIIEHVYFNHESEG